MSDGRQSIEQSGHVSGRGRCLVKIQPSPGDQSAFGQTLVSPSEKLDQMCPAVAGVGILDADEDLAEAPISTLLKQMRKGRTPSTPAVGKKIPGKATGTLKAKVSRHSRRRSAFRGPFDRKE